MPKPQWRIETIAGRCGAIVRDPDLRIEAREAALTAPFPVPGRHPTSPAFPADMAGTRRILEGSRA